MLTITLLNRFRPEQTVKISELETELKIEREWREQLEAGSMQDKETISRLKQEMVYLEKVAGVS